MTITDSVKFRGVPFEFGDSYIIIPPINAIAAEELAEDIDLVEMPAKSPVTLEKNPAGEVLGVTVDRELYAPYREEIRKRNAAQRRVALAAIKRNYPDAKAEDLGDFFDDANTLAAYNAARANYPKAGIQLVKTKGEIQPVNGATSTGAKSTGA